LRFAVELRVFLESAFVGVGNLTDNPQPIPLVIGANGRRWYTIPLRIIPALGQVPENSAKIRSPSSNRAAQSWYVLQQNVSRSYIANDPCSVGPEIAFVFLSEPLSCPTERLTRESRSDNIHASTPGSPVERSHIAPNRRVIEVSIPDPCPEHPDWVLSILDVAHRSPPEQVLRSEQSPTCSGK